MMDYGNSITIYVGTERGHQDEVYALYNYINIVIKRKRCIDCEISIVR